jgi:hypothetical protein
MTSSRSARRARRDERRRRAEPRTEPIPRLRTAGYDATTVIFTGASGTGLPDTEPATQPPAMLRTQPPPFSHAGYDATTGPMPAYGRPPITIGDALTRDDHWGPKLTPLPCGHCGTPPPVPDGILERTRIIGHVNWLAIRAGWAFDCDLTWTCPDCQQGEAWRARQGQLELHRFGDVCDRHDAPPWADVDPDECRCTCPGAVVAVDVMLASEDHLGSGRGRYTAGAR